MMNRRETLIGLGLLAISPNPSCRPTPQVRPSMRPSMRLVERFEDNEFVQVEMHAMRNGDIMRLDGENMFFVQSDAMISSIDHERREGIWGVVGIDYVEAVKQKLIKKSVVNQIYGRFGNV